MSADQRSISAPGALFKPDGSSMSAILDAMIRLPWRKQAGLAGATLILVLFLMSLMSHDAADLEFARQGRHFAVHNQAGVLGAVFSNLGLTMFGVSIWWVPVLAVRGLYQVVMRGVVAIDGRQRLAYWCCVVAMMICSCALEWSAFEGMAIAWMPKPSGGALGHWIGLWLNTWIGNLGSAICCLAVLWLALPVALDMRWRAVGGAVAKVSLWAYRLFVDVYGTNVKELRTPAPELDGFQQKPLPAAGATSLQDLATLARGRAAHTGDLRTAQRRNARTLARRLSADALSNAPNVEADAGTSADPEARRAQAPSNGLSANAAAHAIDSSTIASIPTGRGARQGAHLPTSGVINLDHVVPPALKIHLPAQLGQAAKPSESPKVSEPAKREIRNRPVPGLASSKGPLPGCLPLSLLDPVAETKEAVPSQEIESKSRFIEKKLSEFGVEVRVVEAFPGPVITRYEIEPATGVKGSQIVNLSKDLARALSLFSVRVVETIPGKTTMALELPNAKREPIVLREVLDCEAYRDSSSMLSIGLGKDIVGQPYVVDLAKMPHCLVAGTTGSGKSVGINAMILSLIFKSSPKDVRLILIDPKMLEMSVYDGIPHLLAPVVTDMKHASNALTWCVGEMDRRYRLMSKMGVRNLAGYNAKIDESAAQGLTFANPFAKTPARDGVDGHDEFADSSKGADAVDALDAFDALDRLAHVVVVIDELADLMMVEGKKIEELIARLAQKARASGIHLILATQRPSVDVITGLIKANIPTRLSFQVSSKVDSRTIIDQMGAESLLGHGDMLYLTPGGGLPVRVHGAFVSDQEVHRVVAHLKSMGEPEYVDEILEGPGAAGVSGNGDGLADGAPESDPMFDQAVAVVIEHGKASISLVQRHLRIGYNRAARLLEMMESNGLVGAMGRNGGRDILSPMRDN